MERTIGRAGPGEALLARPGATDPAMDGGGAVRFVG